METRLLKRRAQPTSATDEVTVLRARVKQLEDFIVGLGKKVPPMPLMDAKKAEDIVVSEGFEGLENDPVLSDDDSEDVIEFTHDGVKYYKDSNNNLYAFGCDLDNAELLGTWNEEKNCVEEADSSDEDTSDEDTSDEDMARARTGQGQGYGKDRGRGIV